MLPSVLVFTLFSLCTVDFFVSQAVPGNAWDAYALYEKRASQASRLDAVHKTGPRGRLEHLELINNK